MLTDRQAEAVYRVMRELGVGVGVEFQAHEAFPLETVEDDDPAWEMHDALEELAGMGLAGKRSERRRTWFRLDGEALRAYDMWAASRRGGLARRLVDSGQAGGAECKALFWDAFTGGVEDVVLVNPTARLVEILRGDPDFIGITGPGFGAPSVAVIDHEKHESKHETLTEGVRNG